MNRRIKEATDKRFHYDGRDQLRTHFESFVACPYRKPSEFQHFLSEH